MNPPNTFELNLEFSEQGCAIFLPPERASVTLEVNENNSSDMLKEVVLRGDREGLHALASAIIATAESPVAGSHLHIDEEVNGPVFRSPQGFTLTIDLLEK